MSNLYKNVSDGSKETRYNINKKLNVIIKNKRYKYTLLYLYLVFFKANIVNDITIGTKISTYINNLFIVKLL